MRPGVLAHTRMHTYTFGMTTTVLNPESQGADMARISLRRDQLTKFRRIAGHGLDIDATFARRIGMDPGQVSRILRGAPVGTKFIAGCLEVFGIECFGDLFSVEPEPDKGAAA